jgi:hypothetical protein
MPLLHSVQPVQQGVNLPGSVPLKKSLIQGCLSLVFLMYNSP